MAKKKKPIKLRGDLTVKDMHRDCNKMIDRMERATQTLKDAVGNDKLTVDEIALQMAMAVTILEGKDGR